MRYGCPNKTCEFHQKKDFLVKDGRFFRRNDSRWIQRYKCNNCQTRFSNATFSLAKGQKKRRVNHLLNKLLASGVSMRRAAILLNVNKITVKRKLVYLAKIARINNKKFIKILEKNPVGHIQFDDLLTIEHTKMKPLSVSLAVDVKRRFILGAEVSQIPAFGNLARKSRQKYGYRENRNKEGLDRLFQIIQRCIKTNGLIESDEHNFYPGFVKKYIPGCEHKRYKGRRGCVVGQGELKKLAYDPLFILNHTCAMLRANINRLARKTWCTTKEPRMLKDHLDIFINFYNTKILAVKTPP